MQTTFDYIGVIETLVATDNPEIWHADNLTHPGLSWSIKTIIPKPEFADNDTVNIVQFWHKLASTKFNLVKITHDTFNWTGNLLPQWDTIWIKRGWDIEISSSTDGTLYHKVCSSSKTSAQIAETLIDNIGKQLAKLENIEEREELLDLIEACEVMLSMTTDYESARMRSNFRVIDD